MLPWPRGSIRRAADEEVGIASHFPDLAEHPFGGVENRKIDVAADVEDANLERRMLVGIVEKRDDLVFLARIERARVNFAAGLLDLLDERVELGAVAATGENRKALGGELLCNLAADKITGADHGRSRVSLLRGTSPGQVWIRSSDHNSGRRLSYSSKNELSIRAGFVFWKGIVSH